ncbi:hypothetical protein VIGAN_11207000, partial [Vigna angularis var. angularis]
KSENKIKNPKLQDWNHDSLYCRRRYPSQHITAAFASHRDIVRTQTMSTFAGYFKGKYSTTSHRRDVAAMKGRRQISPCAMKRRRWAEEVGSSW